MIDWTTVLQTTLTGSVMFGITATVVGFVFKSLVGQWLSRDLDRFQADLQRAAFEHQTRFASLHAKRAEVIAKLYEHIVQTQRKLISMTSIMEFVGEPSKEEKIRTAAKSALELVDYFDENRLYLDEELCKKISAFVESTRLAYTDFLRSRMDPTPKSVELWIKATEEMSRDVPPLRSEIEREFRRLLGDDLSPAD